MNRRLAPALLFLMVCGCAHQVSGRRDVELNGAGLAEARQAVLEILRERFPEDLREEPDGQIHGLKSDRSPADSLRPHRLSHVSAWLEAAPGGCKLRLQVLRLIRHGGTPFVYTGPRNPRWRTADRDPAAEDEIVSALREQLTAPSASRTQAPE